MLAFRIYYVEFSLPSVSQFPRPDYRNSKNIQQVQYKRQQSRGGDEDERRVVLIGQAAYPPTRLFKDVERPDGMGTEICDSYKRLSEVVIHSDAWGVAHHKEMYTQHEQLSQTFERNQKALELKDKDNAIKSCQIEVEGDELERESQPLKKESNRLQDRGKGSDEQKEKVTE